MGQFWAMGILLGLVNIPSICLLYVIFGGGVWFGHYESP